MASLDRFCDFMWTACTEWSLGYDQSNRWDVRDGGECDCSSLVITALQEAGFDTGDATYTGNMSDELCARGWERLEPNLDWAQRGDILLNDIHHVCAVVDGDGWDSTIAQASIDERGRASGGQSGDQANETNVRSIYWYRYGWDCILRYVGEDEDAERERREREEAERRAAEEAERHRKEMEELQPVFNTGGDVYRLYNESTGNHMYTTSNEEYNSLKNAGWKDEGVAWKARQGWRAVYRMYNPNNGDHLFTDNFDEAKRLQEQGWKYEGVPFMLAGISPIIFRMYNPNNGLHMYTTSIKERDALREVGWHWEGSYTA